jgi:hypothetical protein
MLKLFKSKEGARAVAESTYFTQPIPEGTTLEQLRGELLDLTAYA